MKSVIPYLYPQTPKNEEFLKNHGSRPITRARTLSVRVMRVGDHGLHGRLGPERFVRLGAMNVAAVQHPLAIRAFVHPFVQAFVHSMKLCLRRTLEIVSTFWSLHAPLQAEP